MAKAATPRTFVLAADHDAFLLVCRNFDLTPTAKTVVEVTTATQLRGVEFEDGDRVVYNENRLQRTNAEAIQKALDAVYERSRPQPAETYTSLA